MLALFNKKCGLFFRERELPKSVALLFPLCVIAAEETQAYLKERTEWREELQTGKMFGVLVVRSPAGEVGYLAAFSGNLAGKNVHPFFVPPIYDLLQPDGFFRQEDAVYSEKDT